MDDEAFLRYLACKRGIDDRSLNTRVWDRLRGELERLEPPLSVLEVGAGIGSSVERLAALAPLAGATYTAVDSNPHGVREAKRRLRAIDLPFHLELETADLFPFAHQHAGERSWDLLVAHAVLDLVDLRRALDALVPLVAGGGLLYLTLNFDGVTAFEPRDDDPAFDARLMSAYHRSMDERRIDGRPSGDSHTGRRLLSELPRHGAILLAAGASDWVVFAENGSFHDEERHFLRFLLDTVAAAVADDPGLDADEVHRWRERRRDQIEDGSLIYVAHQLDVLARRVAAETETR